MPRSRQPQASSVPATGSGVAQSSVPASTIQQPGCCPEAGDDPVTASGDFGPEPGLDVGRQAGGEDAVGHGTSLSAHSRCPVSGPDARGHVEPWPGATDVYLMGADDPTHAGDVTVSLPTGVASLRAHRAYLDGLGRDFDPEEFLRALTARAGAALGVRHAVGFGRIQLQGV
jgi:hypothetical protein